MKKLSPKNKPSKLIENNIYMIRGEKVMIDSDLAELYGVPTKALNQAVNRNKDRFPKDFILRLNKTEVVELNRSQIVTSSQKHRPLQARPYAFTEHGILMLSSVIRSKQAVQVNTTIMRAFVRMRKALSTNKYLAEKLAELEQKYNQHDSQLKSIFEAIRELTNPKAPPKERQIGFDTDWRKNK